MNGMATIPLAYLFPSIVLVSVFVWLSTLGRFSK